MSQHFKVDTSDEKSIGDIRPKLSNVILTAKDNSQGGRSILYIEVTEVFEKYDPTPQTVQDEPPKMVW